jgi:hypothetical protein
MLDDLCAALFTFVDGVDVLLPVGDLLVALPEDLGISLDLVRLLPGRCRRSLCVHTWHFR